MRGSLGDRELIAPANRQEWRAWLAENHDSSASIWLAITKKHGQATKLTYEDAVEEALAFGWIDSTTRTLDEHRFIILMARRKRGGTWARSNKERVARLESQGLMTDAGRSAIEAAKADGSWVLLDDIDALVVPDDLSAALGETPEATAGFEALSPSVRKQLLYWIATARRPETRAKRIAETVAAAAQGRSARG